MEKLEDVIFQELPWERALKKTLPPGKRNLTRTSSEKKQNRGKVAKFFADSDDSRAT